MNNKGQVLVLFVILIPVIFLTILVLIEFGNIYLENNKIVDVIKETINYGLKHKEDEDIVKKVNELIDVNIDYQDKLISISDDEAKITLIKNFKIFNKTITKKYVYKGTIKENKIIIEEG